MQNVDTTRPRSRAKGGKLEVSQDRHALALKHKDDAAKLACTSLVIACSGILAGIVRRDPLKFFATPVPAEIGEYHQEIKNPIDCRTLRENILASKYATLGAFIADARRLW